MKYLLLFTIVCYAFAASAQGDVMFLSKKGQVLKTYISGTYFTCQLSTKQWVEGRIKLVKDDSLFMEQMNVQQVANYWGMPTLDTLKYGLIKISLRNIIALPYHEHGIGVVNNGSLFTIGAGGYILLNILNGLIQNESITSSKNLTNLGIAAGVFMFGEILHWTHPTNISLGKKYQLYTTASIPTK
jgi:hypothetical protein